MILEATKATPGEGLIFPESIEDRGIGGKTWIGVGRGVGGTPLYINVICFSGRLPSLGVPPLYINVYVFLVLSLIYQYNMFF